MRSMELFRKHSGPFACVLVLFAALLCTVMLGTTIVIAQDTEAPEIDHTPVTEGWVGVEILISATVTDNVELDEVWLNYTNVTGIGFNETMTPDGDIYNYTIPAQSPAGTVDYFIWVNDTEDNQNLTATSTITVSVDDVPPEIDHTPVTEGWVGVEILISATVTDNVELDEVWLNYTNVTGIGFNVSMTEDGDAYTYSMPAQTSTGTADYFIWVNDTEDNQNLTATSTITVSVDSDAPEIDHTPVTTANAGVTFNISATVTDNAAVDEVHFDYTDVGGAHHNETMILVTGDTYNYTIPAQSSAGTLEYFIWANDTSDNQNLTGSYTIDIQAADTTDPTITHTPVESATADKEVSIEATITDNVGVESATLYYRKQGDATYTSATMSVSGDTYTATIPASAVTTDGVEYYISATDGVNVATSPATNPTTSPHEIEVTEEAPLDMMWIYLALAVIIIVVIIIAVVAASRRRGAPPEEPYEEEEPPTIE
ncbi:MAG: hypothetical protein LN415_04280 [Candidatus Thermoplasmatota archaeon]|nr:hypothetical protein [Candidatus Thermoplasmatota archaeon]